jgi:hypothetical protein
MLKRRMEQYERRLIVSALGAADWSQRRAAEALGVLPTTLHEKMKRLGIPGRPDPNGQHPSADEDLPDEEGVLEEFRWHGRVDPGQALEIIGVTGTLRAEISGVPEVELVAVKRGALAERRKVVVKVTASRRAVAVVAQTVEGRPVGPEVTVDVAVRVPASVRLITRLPAGRLDTQGVHGVLELRAREDSATAGSDPTLPGPMGRIASAPALAAASKALSMAGTAFD